jgi:hypothetical protein
MKLGRKLWTGALAGIFMTVGSVASASAVLDDFSVAFNNGYIGTSMGATGGATGDPLVFEDVSTVGIGFFDARRTATLTYANALATDEDSLLRVTPGTNNLRFENTSGQEEQVDFLLRYDDFGFSGGGGNTIDLTLWAAFQFEVVSTNDFTTPPSLPATWTVYDGAGQSASIAVDGPGLYQVSFANFGGIALDQVTAIEFGFSNSDGNEIFNNLDIRFGQLSVVPVPPAAGLVLLGMVGLGLRRKFASKK